MIGTNVGEGKVNPDTICIETHNESKKVNFIIEDAFTVEVKNKVKSFSMSRVILYPH